MRSTLKSSVELVALSGRINQRFATAAGNCATPGCDRRYREGEWIWTDDQGSGGGDSCCGPEPEDEFPLPGAPSVGTYDEVVLEDLEQVMPRGRTARDKCQVCWQIPASSGACGCY